MGPGEIFISKEGTPQGREKNTTLYIYITDEYKIIVA